MDYNNKKDQFEKKVISVALFLGKFITHFTQTVILIDLFLLMC